MPVDNGRFGPDCGQKLCKSTASPLSIQGATRSVSHSSTAVIVLLGLSVIGLGAVFQQADGNSQTEQGISTQKKKRRTREERGLPDRKVLYEVAKTYLKMQHELWPDLKGTAALPTYTKKNICKMVQQFEEIFKAGEIQIFRPGATQPIWEKLGVVYLRFSSDKSNAASSFKRQLRPALDRAKRDGCFVPWMYIFADAAVTGTIAGRLGYQLSKSATQSEAANVQILYVDELGRASRALIEAMQLARFV